MRINLPMDLLRNFVAIVDTGSMVKASERVFLTQSALSLQMKRLSDMLQIPILHRQQGTFCLTPAGEKLLVHAREMLRRNDEAVESLTGRGLAGPVRVGMVQDFADEILEGVLARFSQINVEVDLQITVGNSADLLKGLDAEIIDIAVYVAQDGHPDWVASVPMTWLGHASLLQEDVLPLALMSKPCLFRDAALRRLEEMRREYRILLETPSVSVLRPAVASGFAVTCRTAALVRAHSMGVSAPYEEMPRVSYCVTTSPRPTEAVFSLATLIGGALAALTEES